MILISKAILFVIGVCGGIGVSAGLYAFITMLQITQRLSSRTGTANNITFYEDCVMVGGILGNIVSIYEIPIPFGTIFLGILGVSTGIFVGCLAIALAEIIDVFPAISRRITLTVGVPYLVLCIGFGKGLGTFYQLIINRI